MTQDFSKRRGDAMRYPVPSPLSENVFGKYYVLDTCNGCGVCFSMADEFFGAVEGDSYYYIKRQPMNQAEDDHIRVVQAACIVDAIKSDGDSTFFDIWNYDE
jgi:ferredoxin